MIKFIVMFSKPADGPRFEERYNTFLALIERMPSVQRRQVIHVLGSPLGETPLFRILEAYFDDFPAMEASLRSPEGQDAGRQLNQFPGGEFSMIYAEVYEEDGGRTEAQ